MNKKFPQSYLGFIVMLGAVWGLAEAGLGMGLRNCVSFFSGSIMTGIALLFIASSWALTRNFLCITLVIVIASLFKMFDAFLLSLPIRHGAIANPIFALLMEGAAFLVVISIFNEKLRQKSEGQALLGGLSALVAINLFPLVKYATGIPACVYPSTGYPLSLYYAPLAVFLSSASVPLGIWIGLRLRNLQAKYKEASQRKRLYGFASPAAVIICLGLIILIRLG